MISRLQQIQEFNMKPRILVIDDNESILEAMKFLLKGAGYNVHTLINGKAYEENVEKVKPQLILLDIQLSGIDGRVIATSLKKKKQTQGIPIIMMSAFSNAKKSTVKAGANDFIAKPFDMDTVLTKIKNLIGKK